MLRHDRKGVSVSIVVRLSLLVVLAAAFPAGAAAFPGEPGKIAFVSDRDGNAEIYAQNLEGTGLANLSNHPSTDQSPAWSADGLKLAFTSFRGEDGREAIYVMNADGTGQTRVSPASSGRSDDATPAWSPDGTRIAFASTRPFGDSWAVWTMSADGADAQRLTDDFAIDPAWSPDGSQIAYAGRDPETGELAIRVSATDGSYSYPVTRSGLQETQPAWSPDGRWLVFSRSQGDLQELFIAAAGGGVEQQITFGGYDANAVWSPDMRWIMFQRREAGGERELYVLRTSLEGETVPWDDLPGANGEPDWGVFVAPPPPPPGDTTPPLISISEPVGDRPHVLGSTARSFYVCKDGDGTEPLALCAATVTWAGGSADVSSGDSLPTGALGLYTFTVRARDAAGNEASATRTYRVVYAFDWLDVPVEHKAVRELPLRFSLGGDHGLDVLAGAKSHLCSGGSAEAAAGALKYSAIHERYTYVWETERAWAGSCRTFVLELDDGTSHTVDVQLTR
jgi:Tol biopolymer transport system component